MNIIQASTAAGHPLNEFLELTPPIKGYIPTRTRTDTRAMAELTCDLQR